MLPASKKKSPPHGQAHLFFTNAKSQPTKIKELVLPHNHPTERKIKFSIVKYQNIAYICQ